MPLGRQRVCGEAAVRRVVEFWGREERQRELVMFMRLFWKGWGGGGST